MCHFSHHEALPRQFKAFNDIELIENFLQGVVFEEVALLHLSGDMGEKDKGYELNKELAVEA